MWQLHFSRFLKHVFLITLEIRRLLVCSNYVRNYDTITLRVCPHFWITFLWYDCITSRNNVTTTFRFCLLLWGNFITSQLNYLFVQMVSFWWRQYYVELWKLLKRVNCVWKFYYKTVIFCLHYFLSSPTFW